MDAAAVISSAALKPRPATVQKPHPGQDAASSAARQAAQEFEAVFLTTFLEGMFAGLKTDGPFGGGHGEAVYRSLMLGEYAKHIAGNGGLGLADHVYRELLSIQEQSQNE